MKVKSYHNIQILLKFEPLSKNGIGSDQNRALEHFLIKRLEVIKEKGLQKA